MNCNRCFYCGGLLSLVLECNQRSFGLVNPIALYVLVITRVYVEFYCLCCLQFTKTLKIWYNGLLLHSILIDRVHVHIMLVNDIFWIEEKTFPNVLCSSMWRLFAYCKCSLIYFLLWIWSASSMHSTVIIIFYLFIISKCSVYPYPFDGWQFSKQ